ncbi:DUF4031 domain-containing protein [Paraburkholderia aspalathi]|nr:DUF4031 domain-containing protein [Paraburkholderia aspalathi]MBK3780121.1 DUF4031 domain-containing protein [Paraburkholderia aspalathi]
MAVYVDALENWGWKLRGRTVASCHMFTDSLDLEELHLMAERIGMKREWFQPHRIAPHYDLTASRRAAAVKLGALEVRRKEASAIWRARREALANPERALPTAQPEQGSLFPVD